MKNMELTYNIIFSEQANKDIESIYEYIANELLSPINAVNQIKRLQKGISNLAVFPMRNPVYGLEPWHSKGLRFMPVNNYVVFYIFSDKDRTINIIRIMYGDQNIKENL